jgi:hypothetical protein
MNAEGSAGRHDNLCGPMRHGFREEGHMSHVLNIGSPRSNFVSAPNVDLISARQGDI